MLNWTPLVVSGKKFISLNRVDDARSEFHEGKKYPIQRFPANLFSMKVKVRIFLYEMGCRYLPTNFLSNEKFWFHKEESEFMRL